MRLIHLYRALLHLYPADFRSQFSEEMMTVFEQTSRDSSATPILLAKELFSIVKGAYIMWLTRVLRTHQPTSSSSAAITPAASLTISEITHLRHTAIQDMCAAIAGHDFHNARRYSDEEARLKHLLGEMQSVRSADSMTA